MDLSHSRPTRFKHRDQHSRSSTPIRITTGHVHPHPPPRHIITTHSRSHSPRQFRLYRSRSDLSDPYRPTCCVFSASPVFSIPDESHRATSSRRVSDNNESVLDHPFLAVDQEISAESPENFSYRQRTCMAFVHLHVRVDRPRRMCDTC